MLVKRKGASREGWSEGSVKQNCDLTNRNRIRGDVGRTSCLETAKSIYPSRPHVVDPAGVQ